MARHGGPDSESADSRNDILGVVLVALAVLLLVAQMSFDPRDLAFLHSPPNPFTRNWIGPVGAHVAYGFFFVLGAGAYAVPVLIGAFGLGYLLDLLGYLRRRPFWAWLWAFVLVVGLTGLLHMFWVAKLLGQIHERLGAPSAGGWLGQTTYDYGFWMFGRLGAAIVYGTLYLVAMLYLTNFRLGAWIKELWLARQRGAQTPAQAERVLEERTRELEQKKRELEEVAQKAGLGPDLQPVPKPTIRDLTVPAPKPKSEPKPAAGAAPETTPPQPAPEAAAVEQAPVRAARTAETAQAVEKTQDQKASELGAEPAPAESKQSAPRRPKPFVLSAGPKIGGYKLPPIELLNYFEGPVRPAETKEELMANARLMQQTLAQFGIEVAIGDITRGPTITRYELHPAPGVKLERITALSNNLAAALKAERIHILAPVPGKSSVGVEVPNRVQALVVLRDLMETDEWRNTKARIPIALGKDVYGNPIIADLAEMPHLLIAGSTGSGKSVCINAIITSLLYRFAPDELRFVMIDPKVVELQHYNKLPHLVVPVISDPKKVILALRWVVNEMEKRYQIFARVGVRNIWAFNERARHKPLPKREPELPLTVKKERVEPSADGFAVELDEEIVTPSDEDIIIPDRLSYIVVIIDELSDLMLVAPADVEMAIARITQMARAAGIHCIVATQRPSVDVITGVIKANITARIAFQCASKVDSRTILDAMGAEKLIGKGDMLYLPPGSAKLIRAQGALVTDAEIQRVVEFISGQAKPSYELEIHQQLQGMSEDLDSEKGIDEDEELIQKCIEVIRTEQKASVSLLQRRLRLGYTRAARIMDELERRGIVGPSKGAEPRDILIDLDGTGADGRGKQAV
ncbi:MAG: DNA translocase FtsK [Verrucomicrobiae bacterium]|nr:DNA translocase FtsK [Verrucomicrobiae bacterium]